MKLEPDVQIAILFLAAAICGSTTILATVLGPYTGTAISTLVLTIACLIFGQLDDAHP